MCVCVCVCDGGVIDNIRGNRYGDQSSKCGQGCLHFPLL